MTLAKVFNNRWKYITKLYSNYSQFTPSLVDL